jgi:hypothetical protein
MVEFLRNYLKFVVGIGLGLFIQMKAKISDEQVKDSIKIFPYEV